MFDLGWAELLIVAVVALIVIGPRDLPQAMRLVRQWLRKARSLTREFQSGIDSLAKQADLDDVKAEIKAMAEYNPEGELRESLDPGGEISGSLPTGADIDDDSDESESNTEDLESIMDIHDALEEDDTDGDTELDAIEDKVPDVVAAQSTDGAPAADSEQSMTLASVDDAADDSTEDDSKVVGDDAPLGIVMGPVPIEVKKTKAKAKAKVNARHA